MMLKIFKNIVMIALAVCVAIGSFFVPISKKDTFYLASANDVTTDYTFNGSNVYIPLWRSNYDSSTYFIDTGVISFKIRPISSSSLNIDLVNSNVFYNNDTATTSSYNYNFYRLGTGDYNGTVFTFHSYSNFGDYQQFLLLAYSQTSTDIFSTYEFFIFCNSNEFNSNIYKVTFNNENLTLADRYSTFNTITYYDSNDNYVKFLFRQLEGGYSNQGSFQNRTYFFNTELTDNQIYQQGYNQGLVDNQQNIYDNGYNAGYDIGFDRGKVKGGQEANNYSFLGLIGAVVDAPVSILSSLFNFTFLGINLWSFITSLLTIALILFVVKIFMRR